jgi:hypothetical protein
LILGGSFCIVHLKLKEEGRWTINDRRRKRKKVNKKEVGGERLKALNERKK